LGIPLAQFYELVAEKGTPMPDVLNESLLKELRAIARGESREEGA